MLVSCRYTVHDVGPTSYQRWVNVSCLLGQSLWVCCSSTHLGTHTALDPAKLKHDTLTQCWANVSPPSTTLGQHSPALVRGGLWTMLASSVHTIYPPVHSWARDGPVSQTMAQHYRGLEPVKHQSIMVP